MTDQVETPDTNPAASSGDSPSYQAEDVTVLKSQCSALLEQNTALIQTTAMMAGQLNWICQVINSLTQSMPPFMRGAVNVPAHPHPGAGFPTPYPGQH